MSKKSSGIQKIIFLSIFHPYHFPNEIFQSRPLCVVYGILEVPPKPLLQSVELTRQTWRILIRATHARDKYSKMRLYCFVPTTGCTKSIRINRYIIERAKIL